MRKIWLVLAFVLAQDTLLAQTWQDTVTAIERIFERYQPDHPGCQLAISRNGTLVFSKAWGLADLEHAVALTTESVMEAGSVSKQFTAAAILLLEQQQALSLDDDVRKYVPELPYYGSVITLRHLLHHTSGIKDWGSLMALSDWPRGTKTYSNFDVLHILRHQRSLNHQPGDEYLYSNSNYVLLAIIAERVSGKSLAEFTQTHIFGPAGMKHTEWRSSLSKIVPRRAIAYGKQGSVYFTDMPNETVYGNGGLLTTAEDLLRWNNFYIAGKLGNPSLLPAQLLTTKLHNGRVINYAAGLRLDSLRGWKVIAHDGATAAYRCNLVYYPEPGLSIAWLANTAEFDGMADGTAEVNNLLLKDKTGKRPHKRTDSVTVPIEKLKNYMGWYKNLRTNAGMLITLTAGKLVTGTGQPLTPTAKDKFVLESRQLEFQANKQNKFLSIGAGDTIIYERVKPAALTKQQLQEYTGSYYSAEVDSKLTIACIDGKLIIQRYAEKNYVLSPTYKDAFHILNSSVVTYFKRNKHGKITQLGFTTSRVRNVLFDKLR